MVSADNHWRFCKAHTVAACRMLPDTTAWKPTPAGLERQLALCDTAAAPAWCSDTELVSALRSALDRLWYAALEGVFNLLFDASFLWHETHTSPCVSCVQVDHLKQLGRGFLRGELLSDFPGATTEFRARQQDPCSSGSRCCSSVAASVQCQSRL